MGSKLIKPFMEGDSSRTAFSAGTMNEIIEALNTLLSSQGRGGIRIIKGDAGFIFEGNFSGSAGGSGSITNQYTSSMTSSTIYNCLCRYS